MNNYHESVLLSETVDYLDVQKGAWYVDGTLGGGGHTWEILRRGGKVLGIDQDEDALLYVRKFRIENSEYKIDEDIKLVRGNFAQLEEIVKESGIKNIAGVVLDFGVSSHQFDSPERGFSFQNGPLDMRMDNRLGVTAKDLVHALSKEELTRLFERYGEERFAKVIASTIVEKREKQEINTTEDLVRIITSVIYPKKGKAHPATRVFQALRIAVNDELHSIEDVLPQGVNIVRTSGRIVTITFHSLEDRIVKSAFLQFEQEGKGKIITKKPIIPSNEEIERNPRSRSAKLRVFEKLG